MNPVDQMMQDYLDKYADVMLRVGLGFRAGQRLHISVRTEMNDLTPEIVYLVHKVSEVAYKLGAKNVLTDWQDGEEQLIRLQHSTLENLEDFPPLAAEQFDKYIDDDGAFLSFYGRNPDLLNNVDAERLQIMQKATGKHFHSFSERLARNEATWLVVGLPVSSWARKVYPALTEAEALQKLWEQVFALSRLSGPDPVADWRSHIDNLYQRTVYLNGKQYAELRYNGPGTDLRVGMPQDHHWEGASSVSKTGITFVANIPTEEVFSMPDYRKVNGVVTATFPFDLKGTMIEGMSLTFVEGCVTEARATKNLEFLERFLDRDEGARSLGEIALVPHSSPISQSRTIYHNGLFDENAACHMALGAAYPINIKGGELLADEELKARGANISNTHADFMVGSGELNIDGISQNGTVEPIMRQGEWAFAV